MPIVLEEIFVYPIKSLKGVSLKSAQIEPRGLRHDRRWMLVDDNGRFISQREFPEIALLSVAFHGEGLIVTDPAGRQLLVPYYLKRSTSIIVKVWSDECEALSVDTAADEWFSEYLSTRVALVVMPDSTRRRSKGALTPEDIVSFADAYPIVLIGENSLADLNSRLDEPIMMNRFRPNLVTSGHQAFSEDTWQEISIGTERLHAVSNTGRCVMTNIVQETAKRMLEPLQTLATYRLSDQKIKFGRNLIPASFGWIHVGDEVEVILGEL
jgi:uncharacterized protein